MFYPHLQKPDNIYVGSFHCRNRKLNYDLYLTSSREAWFIWRDFNHGFGAAQHGPYPLDHCGGLDGDIWQMVQKLLGRSDDAPSISDDDPSISPAARIS